MQQADRLKLLDRLAVGVTVIVLFIIGMMRRVKFDTDLDFSFLPPFHATLNGITAIVLIAAFIAIKNNDRQLHKRLMYTAILLSLLFLLSYVTYHFTTEETRFCKEGMIRKIYFFFLISHVIMAGGNLAFHPVYI